MSKRVGFISLGCPKNRVDSEMMLAKLQAAGFEIIDEIDYADIIIINTCAFIEDAKKEAIENILEMAELKETGVVRKIVVTGCLAERYHDEILTDLPEVDGVVGLGANGDIVEICNRVLEGETVDEKPEKTAMPLEGERLLTTPGFWAYLKIADGCSNNCTYCSIPSIRGPFRSRSMEGIIKEAKELAEAGVKELLLIAQDTTRYGEDIYGKLMLPELLKELVKIEKLQWIRLLYCYPDRITDELLETMAENEKILNYIDLPLQHADAKILRKMNRRGNPESLLSLVNRIREFMPDAVIRTTFITGFPGEGDEEFENLCSFIESAKFDRLGCFTYSPEEGTFAAEFDGQVEDDVKAQRAERIMLSQFKIFEDKQKALIGTVQDVVVEGYDGYSDSYYGRTWRDAPEIDSAIKFVCPYDLDEGEMVKVEVFDTEGYDLIGEVFPE
ncbi:MAG: 30S ribosomal protein S12 methylthiotransferase RimO [Acutalibacteraceae bacterium]|jgi:ribosomal protein S12 methylthiotransferase